jgi:predicted dehydrogenase
MKRCIIVGVGGRHKMFRDAIVNKYCDEYRLVALCDSNLGRMHYAQEELEKSGIQVNLYTDTDFRKLIKQERPDTIIITSPDFTHHKYLIEAARHGCQIICEKPITNNLIHLKQIIRQLKQSGASATITHNYRYSPHRSQIKELLQSGAIGTIKSITFDWHLDRIHGADYFRRWHRYKGNSGGLAVHKATHHFDLINWWLADVPAEVYANGSNHYYNPENFATLDIDTKGQRCTTCPSRNCPFRLDLQAIENLKRLYADNEHYDGYFRDQCVFDESIEIEDSLRAEVRYSRGAVLNYGLVAFSPWEGYEITFVGTEGLLSQKYLERSVINGDESSKREGTKVETTLHLPGEAPREIKNPKSAGGHGGADPLMLDHIFADDGTPDPLNRKSNHLSAAWSAITGYAINRSMQDGRNVRIEKLFPNLEVPYELK